MHARESSLRLALSLAAQEDVLKMSLAKWLQTVDLRWHGTQNEQETCHCAH